jgi:uncharacterized membrane protein YdcZ (DUF606 family)
MGGGFVVAVMVGAGIAVQVAILGRAAGQLSPLAVSLALMIPGLVAATVWATATRSWADVAVVPGKWWWLLLGVGGWLVVAALGFAADRIGVTTTLSLSIATQLAVGLVIDLRTGDASIDPRLLAGLALLGAGSWLMVSAS